MNTFYISNLIELFLWWLLVDILRPSLVLSFLVAMNYCVVKHYILKMVAQEKALNLEISYQTAEIAELNTKVHNHEATIEEQTAALDAMAEQKIFSKIRDGCEPVGNPFPGFPAAMTKYDLMVKLEKANLKLETAQAQNARLQIQKKEVDDKLFDQIMKFRYMTLVNDVNIEKSNSIARNYDRINAEMHVLKELRDPEKNAPAENDGARPPQLQLTELRFARLEDFAMGI